ncbi:MAG: tetratricopeptide repeat protein [Planctomycetota bacterium]
MTTCLPLCLALGLLHSSTAGALAWLTDFDRALAQARSEGKLVLVHFAAADRPLADAMQRDAFADPRVVALVSQRLISVRLTLPDEAARFDALVGGHGALATCIVDATGDVLSSLAGHKDAEAFLQFVCKALDGEPRLQQARAAAAERPADAQALFALALAYLELDSQRRALQMLERIVALPTAGEPYRALAHERLARLCALKGRNRDARAHLAQFRALDAAATRDRRDNALLTEALVCGVEMKYADAIRALGELLAQYPDSDEIDQAQFVSGVIYHEAGDDQRSLHQLNLVIAQYPQSPWCSAARRQIEHNQQSPAGSHRH